MGVEAGEWMEEAELTIKLSTKLAKLHGLPLESGVVVMLVNKSTVR